MRKLIHSYADILPSWRLDSPERYLSLFVALWVGYLLVHVLFIAPVFHLYIPVKLENGVILRELAFKTVTTFFTLALPIVYFSKPNFNHVKLCGLALSALALFICFQWIIGAQNIYRSETFIYDGSQWVKSTSPPTVFEGLSGTLVDKNNTAALMVAGFLASLSLNKKYLSALFFLALLATQSKAGLIASLVCVSYLIHPRLMLAFIPLAPLLLLSESFTSRFPIWLTTWDIIKSHPWGTGLGTFAAVYQTHRTETDTAGIFAHNDLLQFATELGWVAPIIFIGLLISAWRANDKTSRAVILGLFLMSMVEFQFYVPSIAMIFALAIGTRFNKTAS